MRLVADMHISPRTVTYLRELGHDVLRVDEALRASASDQEVLEFALADDRTVLTQDLDFSRLAALSGLRAPSVISLRLSSSRVEHVNEMLARVLPSVADSVATGSLVTVEDDRIRTRSLPVS